MRFGTRPLSALCFASFAIDAKSGGVVLEEDRLQEDFVVVIRDSLPMFWFREMSTATEPITPPAKAPSGMVVAPRLGRRKGN